MSQAKARRTNNSETTPKYDYLLIVTIAALLIVGLMMVYSATFALGYQLYGQPTYFFVRQLLWAGLGLIAMVVAARIEYHTWRKWSIPIMASALLLLGLVLAVGSDRFGGQRWLLNGSVQPSELAKLAVIIYIADWLSSKGARIRQVTYGLIPFAILLGFVTGLIMLQPDFSTATLIFITAIAMFFIAGGDLWQMIASGILGGATFTLLITRSDYRLARITSFLNPMGDQLGSNYQIRQILIALGSGGITGLGLGASRQKFGYIPASHTDGIFAILGEELGLIGCLIVIALFALLAYRGFRVAMVAPDAFGTVLAAGITCSLIFQALINIAVVTATAPFTGLPLPFISFGGSSLVISMTGVGLVLAVSRGTLPEEVEYPEDQEEMVGRASNDLRRWDRRSRVSRPDRRRLAGNR
ncbi:MAG: putative lipid II flippase FtsW [Anaerolineales bacterium]|nr:MAG: putative lipid II flippase FtsW [Anaerolineales bacterium]